MEEHGLVIRKDYQEIPPRVESSLSVLGKSLESVLEAMHEWGEKHGLKISSKKNKALMVVIRNFLTEK